MKRQIQLRGERDWAGDDLIDLQAEPVKAIDAIFAPYPACVISGCGITVNGANFEVAPGYVSLKGTNHENQSISYVVPFSGVTATTLPIYLALHCDVVSDVYGDGGMKPIAHNYSASATTIKPSAPHLEISTTAKVAFVDVVQDATHRFLSDAERATWSRTLQDAKVYADSAIAALVNSSPQTLNTLNELADALGNDPNFATTVMTEIGKRATQVAFDAAMAKLDPTKADNLAGVAKNGFMSFVDKAALNSLNKRSYTAVAGIVDYSELDAPPFVLQNKDLTKLKGDFSVSCSDNGTYTVTHNAGNPNLPHVNSWGGVVGIGPFYGPTLSNITNNSFDVRNWTGDATTGNSYLLTFIFSVEVF